MSRAFSKGSARAVLAVIFVGRTALAMLALLLAGVVPALGSVNALDLSFANPGVDGPVASLALQPDGAVLIGGNFDAVGGEPRSGVARLNADGTLDTTFANPEVVGRVSSLALQPNGKVVIGGWFRAVGGQPRSGVARLNGDGTLDTSFANPEVANDGVNSIALQPDGKVLIGGPFASVAGQPRGSVARLNSNGSLDSTFGDPAINRSVTTLALQPDGRVLIGGVFNDVAGTSVGRVVRLTAAGALDPTFIDPQIDKGSVDTIAVDLDGNVLIGGDEFNSRWQFKRTVVRLKPDGGLDLNYMPSANGEVTSFGMQPDGKVLMGGLFTWVTSGGGSADREGIARMNPNFSIDTAFVNMRVNDAVTSFAVQPNASILIAGRFSMVDGQPRSRVARLLNASWPLSVSRTGKGGGVVTSRPGGVDCGIVCNAPFGIDERVTLTANPGDSSYFTGWGGECTGTSRTCEVTMSQARSVSAGFEPEFSATSLGVRRSGPGRIVSSPPGIDCGDDCTQGFRSGAFVSLFAEPNDTARFTGWSGACSGGAATCSVWMTGPRDVRGTFAALPKDAKYLTVASRGQGGGTVTSTPAGINCGDDCTQGFVDDQRVTLKANPADDARFAGWGGACSGTSATCTLTMSQNRGVIATFDQLPAGSPVLSVAKAGTGTGTVTSSPIGINCGADCRQGYLQGAKVTLTAAPGAGARFDGWAGACFGPSSTCALTMNASSDVTAAFTQVADLISARAKARAQSITVTSRIRMSMAGKITQRATTGTAKKLTTWCRTSRTVRSATTATLTCTLGARARQRLRTGPLALTLRTTITPTSGGPVQINRTLRVARAR